MNGKTITPLDGLLFPGNGSYGNRMSLVRQSARKVFHENFRAPHPVRRK